ncbi:MAG: hypothetical protein JJT78_01650 [Leptospira sp.]|nr:hypothetical protein [Leptospira sp.]
MSVKNSRIEDSRDFFEKKFRTKILLEEFEKSIFNASKILDEAIELIEKMEEIALKRKAYYFLHRCRRLKLQLDDMKETKGYEKKDFDFSYKLLDKIDENESSDFLDSLLKGSIEKVAKSLTPTQEDSHQISRSQNIRKKYFTFTFRGVYFLAEKNPQRIIKNVNPNKVNVRIGKKRYPIYPGPNFGIAPQDDEISEPVHLCILKVETPNISPISTYRCFFFHRMDKEIQFDESTVKSRLKPLESGISPYINNFFRYAGRNYYLIETQSE